MVGPDGGGLGIVGGADVSGDPYDDWLFILFIKYYN